MMAHELKKFLKAANELSSLPKKSRYTPLVVKDYPFDQELLSLSPLYRLSRQNFLSLGGSFAPHLSSVARSLSGGDIFNKILEYSPTEKELLWFMKNHQEVATPEKHLSALLEFNGISLFHEQNHRLLWHLLPPAPRNKNDLRRYLNFVESLVVTLDLALGDQVGARYAPHFEFFKTIYRPHGSFLKEKANKKEIREYYLALMYTTYLILEMIHTEDIPQALQYMFPGPHRRTQAVLKRSFELSDVFVQNTNRLWQERHGITAAQALARIHRGSIEEVLTLPEDPLDFEKEFEIAHRVFNYFAL